MPSVNYEDIYKKSLSMIDDLKLATYTKDDFYEALKQWLHNASSYTLLRKKFTSYILDDEIMQLSFELVNSVDEYYDIEYVKAIMAKGVIISYFPTKLEQDKNFIMIVGGKEEKNLANNNYSRNMERLDDLKREWELELTRHSYYFGEYGGTNG
nr:MAG TPA: hypothetical protein [Caudoviricetes sp.]